MSKRAGTEAVKAAAKRPKEQSKSFESDWEEKINSADLSGCKLIRTKLERLLSVTKARIAKLEVNEEKRGLNYTGEDAVECGCGNTIQSGGDYSLTCDECSENDDVEQCTECIMNCTECEKHLCSEHQNPCSGCGDDFCQECLTECHSCGEGFCNRTKEKECSLVEMGYRGDCFCVYCLER